MSDAEIGGLIAILMLVMMFVRKWVSPSPKYVGVGTDDRVIGGRRDGNRLLGEAMKEQFPSL